MSDKLTNVTFNKDTMDLIGELGAINSQIIVEKDEKKQNILISRKNPATTIAYIFKAPVDHFNFNGDNIAFYNFPEFYQMISCFDQPTIKQNSNKIIVSQGSAKINYVLTDAETLKKGPGKVNFSGPDATINLPSDELKELEKMIGLFGALGVELTVKDNSVVVKVFNDDYDNSFQKEYKSVGKNKSNFSLKISSEVFVLLPKEDYNLEIKKEGIVRFSFNKNGTELDLFTAELEEND